MNTSSKFQILEVLNPKSKADLLLIKHVTSSKLFACRTVSLQSTSKEKREILCNKICRRIQQQHPLLVKFHPVIEDDKMKMLYIPMEYFSFGNLAEFLKKLGKSDVTHIKEEFIVKVLFQLLILLKTFDMYNHITSKTLFCDKYFNVKVLNFSMFCNSAKCDIKMCDIGGIIMQLCTLNNVKMCNMNIVNNEHYSPQFIDLTEMMLNDTNNVKVNTDKVLCHPVILTKTFKLNYNMKLNGCFEMLDYKTKLENLREREAVLKAREKKMENTEHSLKHREKKIIICEKEIKNKLIQAELYLKRCKETKPFQIHKYKVTDNSGEYEELESSHIAETSKKMNIDDLEKSAFTRKFSERRVKFKGHSPLKEMNFHRVKSVRKSKVISALFENPCIEGEKLKTGKIESKNMKNVSDKSEENRKVPSISSAKSIEIQDVDEHNKDCVPIAWSEENKKQAFDLLRIMNSTLDKHSWTEDVKHTYL